MLKLLLALSFIPLASANSIPVLGLNARGTTIIGDISPQQYTQTLLAIKRALDKQTIPAAGGGHWQLRKISFGLGSKGEIGFGPFKYGKALKQRFVYAR